MESKKLETDIDQSVVDTVSPANAPGVGERSEHIPCGMCVVVDGAELSFREINKKLKELASVTPSIVVKNPGSKHHLGVGLQGDVQLIIDGSAGYFAAGLIEGPSVTIKGNAGWFVADTLLDNEVMVEGNVGTGAAPSMRGGLLVVKGHASSRAGQVMKGGTILIFGNAGFMTGMMMFGGRIIVLGDIGDNVGECMMGGAIYVAGTVGTLGLDAAFADVPEAEVEEIQRLVRQYDNKERDLSKMRKIVSVGKELRYHDRMDLKLGSTTPAPTCL